LIYFSRHVAAPGELETVRQAIDSGATSGDSVFTAKASAALRALHGNAHVLLTTSGTHALELSALGLGLGPGDEVVLPSYTFSSTANAFALRGCQLRFADIHPGTFSMELPQLEAALTPATRAIVTVAYGGVMRDIEGMVELAKRRQLLLIEDNAHGLFGKVHGRPLGTFGVASALSFHATKNISCGEGGALVLNDASALPTFEMLREKGTDRSRFLRGEVDKYTWRGIGSSFLPSDILAAVLTAQLEHAPTTQARRIALWNYYRDRLKPEEARLGIQLQEVPSFVEHPAHVFALLVPPDRPRGPILRKLKEQGIPAVSHYEPLHLAPASPSSPPLPVTDDVTRRLVRLPLHAALTTAEAEQVVTALVAALEQ
jgi:dTDP-4-amino-4,6-dideoxygalactose transaminase